MAAVSKAFALLPRKSDRSDAELGEWRQSHTLMFGKCLWQGKLSALYFPLKLSLQMAHPEFTQMNSLLSLQDIFE